MKQGQWTYRILAVIGLLAVSACSGIETIPAATETFEASKYSTYAWRSEPLSQEGYTKDKFTQADPAIRSAIGERLEELGYREVAKDDAEFLIEYLAGAGIRDSRLAASASNVNPSNLATINRLPDGATVDNAYALSGVKETGNLVLVFVDAQSKDMLWNVQISTVIQDANKVNERAVRGAIRQGLSTLPDAS